MPIKLPATTLALVPASLIMIPRRAVVAGDHVGFVGVGDRDAVGADQVGTGPILDDHPAVPVGDGRGSRGRPVPM